MKENSNAPDSLGIHTVVASFLDNGEITRFSAIWLMEVER